MSLFDLVKDPELAERAAVKDESPVQEAAPAVGSDAAFPVEIQRLRERAREVDARQGASCNCDRHPLDSLAQEFLRTCLEAGAAAAEATQHDAPQLRDRRYSTILRVCTVPLILGEWKAVVRGRESALAAVAELTGRGFASPSHRFIRDGQGWTLAIIFGF